MATKPRRDSSQLQTVLRSLHILEMFSEEQRDFTLAEICLNLRVPKSTGSRFLNTLIAAGYLERTGIGRYRLGPGINRLAPRRDVESQLRRAASPYIQELVNTFGESVHLGVRRGRMMVTISFVEGTHTIRMASHVGACRPIHASSMGKALLAFSEPSVINQILSSPLQALTSRTLTDPDVLRHELSVIRQRGYAVDNEEVEEGLRCVGAPIFNYSGQAIAGVSISGPSFRLTLDRIGSIGLVVKATAARISNELGWKLSDHVVDERLVSTIEAI